MIGAAEDIYLQQFIGALALDLALKRGVIDQLNTGMARQPAELDLEPAACEILLKLLVDAGVCEAQNGAYLLTADFAEMLRHRRADLEHKLAFLRLTARDLLDGMPDLLFDLPEFMARSGTFKLFRYDKAMATDADSLAHSRRWFDYVTSLTRSEAPALVPAIDLAAQNNLLEIGGNSGEFALALLAANPGLTAKILDLPAVCHLGREHVAGHAEATRLQFVSGDARRDEWPQFAAGPGDVVFLNQSCTIGRKPMSRPCWTRPPTISTVAACW